MDPVRSLRRLAAWFPLAILLPLTARAELSPMLYLCWARKAPEALELHVQRIDEEPPSPDDNPNVVVERVTLQVERVRRSATGLQAGELIHILQGREKYPKPRRLLPGAAILPLLEVGQHVQAFLVRAQGRVTEYYPAAEGWSYYSYLWNVEPDPTQVAEKECR